MKEQMKDTQNEIKQDIQGTNSDRKEPRTQIYCFEDSKLFGTKGINKTSNQYRMKKQEFKKVKRDTLVTLEII